jgi:hypothetical protein
MFNAIVYTILVISLIANVYLFALANKHWNSIQRVSNSYSRGLDQANDRIRELKKALASTNEVCAKALELNHEQHLKIQELKNRISF